MLKVENLQIVVDEKKVLDDVSLEFETGKNYCILWKNWSWKSSLALSIMWHPSYELIEWKIFLDWEDITDFSPEEKAKAWIFLAFQTIPEVKWVKLFEFLRTIYNSCFDKNESFVSFKRIIEPMLQDLWIEKDFLWRDLNVGFSWWEKRKVEILQLKLLKPRYIILDEVDSWLDVDAFRAVADLLKQVNWKENCFIVITHYFSILEYLPIDEVYVLEKWKVTMKGWNELVEKVKAGGFANLAD